MKCNSCNNEAEVQIIYNRKHRNNYCIEHAKLSIHSGYAYKSLKDSNVILDIKLEIITKEEALQRYEKYPNVIKEINYKIN